MLEIRLMYLRAIGKSDKTNVLRHDLLKLRVIPIFTTQGWTPSFTWRTLGDDIESAGWIILDGSEYAKYFLDTISDDYKGQIIVIADGEFEHEKANFVLQREEFVCCNVAITIHRCEAEKVRTAAISHDFATHDN
ncbi:MAG: hypothetical protein NTW79_00575 [Candidatus Berkelbacteria bacterium]|nr:hypothetical protein [Candidatus Berkelbacteria bacterium]